MNNEYCAYCILGFLVPDFFPCRLANSHKVRTAASAAAAVPDQVRSVMLVGSVLVAHRARTQREQAWAAWRGKGLERKKRDYMGRGDVLESSRN